MEIQLDHLIPEPLSLCYSKDSDVWSKNICLEAGKMIHICAPSGSGKTTLIHLLYGLRKDFLGKLRLNGMDYSSSNEDEWQKLRLNKISIIFQDLKLFEDLSAWENLILKNQLTNHLSVEDMSSFAKRLGVFHLLDKKIRHISRGERQRIAIIRSLCMPFEVLLMDEPFSHLDSNNASIAAVLILEQAQKNKGGVIMANLEQDNWFPYQQKLKLN